MWAVLGRGIASVVFLAYLGACNANPAPTSTADGLAALLANSYWVYEVSPGQWAVGNYAGSAYRFDQDSPDSLSMTPGGVLLQNSDRDGVTFAQMNPANSAQRKNFRLTTVDQVQAATIDPSGSILWLHLIDDSGAELVDRGVARVDLATGALTKVAGIAERDDPSQSYFLWSPTGHTLVLVRCLPEYSLELGHCPWRDVIDTSALAAHGFEQAVRSIATSDSFAIVSDERDPNTRQFAVVDLISGDIRGVAPAVTGICSAYAVDDSNFVLDGVTDAGKRQLLEVDARTGAETMLDEIDFDPDAGVRLGPWSPRSSRWIVLIAPPLAPSLDRTRGAEGRIYDLEQHAFSEQTAQIRLP